VKQRTLLAVLAGAGLLIWLLLRTGLTPVIAAAGKLGVTGLAAIVGFQLFLTLIMGGAWALLGRGGRPIAFSGFVWARLTRDAVSQALPLTQVGGLVIGGRALALEGMAGDFALASTISDLAVEFVTQIAFVALGGALLAWLRPKEHMGGPVLAVVGALAIMATGMVLAQFWGARWIESGLRRVLRITPSDRDGGGEAAPVARAFRVIARRPAHIVLACALHLAAWLIAALQTWLTLALLGVRISLGGAVVLDSLTAGVKAVAFFIPASLGVQEGMLVWLGLMFGVAPGAALALSLARRARDLIIGLPVLGAWQWRHGARIWRREADPPTAAGRLSP
jgi:putative membrane protein